MNKFIDKYFFACILFALGTSIVGLSLAVLALGIAIFKGV